MEDYLLSDPFTARIAEGTGCHLLEGHYSVTHDNSCGSPPFSSDSYQAHSDKDEELLMSDMSDIAPMARGSSSDSEGQTNPRLQPSPPMTLRAVGGPCQHCGVKGDSCAFSKFTYGLLLSVIARSLTRYLPMIGIIAGILAKNSITNALDASILADAFGPRFVSGRKFKMAD